MAEVEYSPIGTIRTPFPGPKGMPKGPDARKASGTVEVRPEFAPGLRDLERFFRIVLVFHMHLSEGPLQRVRPWNDSRERGVFSTRSPRRPNPTWITVVRLERIDGNVLHVSGVDMVDGTPLLDIKLHLPRKKSTGGAQGRSNNGR